MSNNNQGTIRIGRVRTTENQEKKHYTQMTNEELTYLKNKLHNMNKRNLVISTHARDKNEFNDADIKQLPFEVTNDMIIEFNRTEKRNFIDKRVTVRSKKVYDVNINGKIEKCNIIAVFSLTTNRVVTVFWNLASDMHESINMSRYNKDLKILP